MNTTTTTAPSHTELRLPKFFADHMVLQREQTLPIWGWAKPGDAVTVSIAGKSASTTAGKDGKWMARLDALEAGGPFELSVKSGEKTIKLVDVLVGDVWICSGQSNMEWPLHVSMTAEQSIPLARFDKIRHAYVLHTTSLHPQEDMTTTWTQCTPQTAREWTAVGYFFGTHLHQKLKVPIGLLHTSWGGSNCQTWCSAEALEANEQLKYMAEMVKPDAVAKIKESIDKKIAVFEANCTYTDPGNAGFAKGWAGRDLDARDWKLMDVPRFWESVPGMNIDGAVWFRKEIKIPANWAGKPLTLSLGAVDDFDTTYFNGFQIGAIGKETPNWWTAPRVYTVPPSLVKAGKGVIAVRVFDRIGNGGLVGGATMSLALEGSNEGAIRLEGEWQYMIEVAYEPKPAIGWPDSSGLPGEFNAPCAVYNAMIAPLIPFGIKGAIWYQGESNGGSSYEYRTLFPQMIRDWRGRWGHDFPFFFVQLANFMERDRQPQESAWAELREAQRQALAEPNTGMAVIIDVGEAGDIHPRNKHDVGRRLALAAEAVAYGLPTVHSGPTYDSVSFEGTKMRLRFKNIGGGLVSMGGVPTAFAIAGEDRKFFWAEAHIEGSSIVVSSPEVPKPLAVRYGWGNNPPCNLYNFEGLPASPFKTDDWPWITRPR